MATILVADDRPTNRQLLVTLLGYMGHRVVEAADGIEALEVARAERPSVMIVDIVMPRLDGVEFVRQLRKDPQSDSAAVMFYTATYNLAEAEALARNVGVTHLLQKPAEPEAIIKAVESALADALGTTCGNDEQASLAAVHRHFSENVMELERLNVRLAATIELAMDLAMEDDPQRMIQTACRASRSICQAAYAAVGILDKEDQSLRLFAWDAGDATYASVRTPPPQLTAVLAQVVDESRCIRMRNLDANPMQFTPPPPLILPSIRCWPSRSPRIIARWAGCT